MFSIVRTLSIAGEGPAASRYVVIPMARLLDNNEVRKNNSVSLVPLDGVEEGVSAIVESEMHHRPQHAPDTPEEPQIGFRYDSSETFQEAMRYGRRSKLELLWRLGAIPYSRGLDKRTLPWEVTDRAHITEKTWGSIPGVEGAETKDSIIYQPHGEDDPWGAATPERGPLAYLKAGWVYRLFSGHKSQEEHSTEAVTLRNTNRIRGIVAFLERLDERVARGEHGCFGEEENPHMCGFNQDRTWSFQQHDVERLRQKYKIGRRDAVQKIERYEQLIAPTVRKLSKILANPSDVHVLDAQEAATDAALLAMAGYLTSNSTYSLTATSLITQRFVKRTPLFYSKADSNDQLIRAQANEEGDQPPQDDGKDVVGYAFPPFPREANQVVTWNADLGQKLSSPDSPPLPFDPITFDVRPRPFLRPNFADVSLFCSRFSSSTLFASLATPSLPAATLSSLPLEAPSSLSSTRTSHGSSSPLPPSSFPVVLLPSKTARSTIPSSPPWPPSSTTHDSSVASPTALASVSRRRVGRKA